MNIMKLFSWIPWLAANDSQTLASNAPNSSVSEVGQQVHEKVLRAASARIEEGECFQKAFWLHTHYKHEFLVTNLQRAGFTIIEHDDWRAVIVALEKKYELSVRYEYDDEDGHCLNLLLYFKYGSEKKCVSSGWLYC